MAWSCARSSSRRNHPTIAAFYWIEGIIELTRETGGKMSLVRHAQGDEI
jgi:hypothetical protein